jgi:hypothetical protein
LNKLFFIQIATSFILGGAGVALLSFIAERTSSRMAGIVLAFPSTGALGYFFLAWALSPEAVATVIPATFIPLGLTAMFPVFYTVSAEALSPHLRRKGYQVAVSFLVSTGCWLALAVPVALYKFSDLALGMSGYILLVLIADFLLHRRSHTKAPALSYTAGQKIGRAAFVGLIIVIVLVLGKTLDIVWGGVFAMFPAAFSSTLMLLHWYYDAKSVAAAAQNAPIGSLSICAYSIAVMFVFPRFGFIAGTVLAYCASLLTTFVLLKIQAGRGETLRSGSKVSSPTANPE